MTVVRAERVGDEAAIRTVNEAAFGVPDEARLVDQLRAAGKVVASLVAEQGGAVVGHILFSPATIDGQGGPQPAAALAPMAVLPQLQGQGIGSRLVEAGLAACRDAGLARAVVLGHADYYPRFGFRPAHEFGLICPFEAPPEAFMALALRPGGLDGCAGQVRFASEFDAL